MSLKNIHKITESKRDNRSLLLRVQPPPASDAPSAQVALERPHMADTAARLTDEILPAVPVRQWVLSTFRDPLSSRMGREFGKRATVPDRKARKSDCGRLFAQLRA